jgi:type II secretory pathway component PulF
MSAVRVQLQWVERWSIDEQIQFFEQLHMLLSAGLLVWQALNVLACYGSRLRRALAHELSQCVKHGSSLTNALEQCFSLTDPLTRCLIAAGEDAGDLPVALGYVSTFLGMRQNFRKKIYAAARVPLVTFAFFCTIVLIIFLAIVPSFEQVLTLTNQANNSSLHRLFAISHAVNSLGIIGILLLSVCLVALGYVIGKSGFVQRMIQWCLTHVPGIAGIYWAYELAGFFQAVALLVRGGKGLVESLQLSIAVLDNWYIKQRLIVLIQQVNEGQTLEQAFSTTCKEIQPDVSSLLAVGGHTGMLAPVLEQSAHLFFDYAQRQLNRWALMVQPVLMALLGILIALLLYAVYVPIIQLPQTLSTINL